MKVYQCIKEIHIMYPTYNIYRPGDKFYEMVGNTNLISGIGCYQPERGYPIVATEIESDTEHYERLPDDDHNPGYYLDKVYTQYQVDTMKQSN